MATSIALRCWWSAAPTRRQRTTCAALRPLSPPPAACCGGTVAFAQRCALQKRGARARGRGANGGAFQFISVCRAAQPPALPRACALPHACEVTMWQRRGGSAAQGRGRWRICALPQSQLLRLSVRWRRATPRAWADMALRGSCSRAAPHRAAPRLLACAARYSPPLPTHFRLISLPPLRMRLGCALRGCASVPLALLL
jgi:hypothetical protein